MTVHWRRLAEGAASVAALCSVGSAAQPAAKPTMLEFEPGSVSVGAKSVAPHRDDVLGQLVERRELLNPWVNPTEAWLPQA